MSPIFAHFHCCFLITDVNKLMAVFTSADSERVWCDHSEQTSCNVLFSCSFYYLNVYQSITPLQPLPLSQPLKEVCQPFVALHFDQYLFHRVLQYSYIFQVFVPGQ